MLSARLIVLATAAFLLAACSQAPEGPQDEDAPGGIPWPTQPSTSGLETAQAAVAAGGFLFGENARWPADIPPDIPPLTGQIRMVTVIPGLQYRIAYSLVSDEDLTRYLEDLEALGFRLEYIVYTAPSIPDEQTQAKIARGA